MTLILLGGKVYDVAASARKAPCAPVVVSTCTRCGQLREQALSDDGTRAACMVCGWINPQPKQREQ